MAEWKGGARGGGGRGWEGEGVYMIIDLNNIIAHR